MATAAPGGALVRRRRTAALCAALALVVTGCSLRPVDLGSERTLPLRSRMLAADGRLLTQLYRQNRALVPLEQISPWLPAAVIAAEDARFYEHEGFDVRAIMRAAVVNTARGETVQGGSTLTQQYVKNVFFRTPPRTFERKARELRLAIEVERRFSKDEILERYLNTIYFGSGAYGAKAAAEAFFENGVQRLTLPQAALLAAVIKAPALYDPRDHPKRALRRRNYVLERMEALGLVSAAQADRAMAAPLRVLATPPRPRTREPYFVAAVQQEFMRDRRFGTRPDDRDRLLWEGGVRIQTTLVPRLQRAAERAVAETLNAPGDPSAALVAIRPQTGEIVAMVGGEDWSASQVNLALGRAGGGSGRQPGSSFKPLVLATAMERGISLETTYPAGPGIFTFPGGETWVVRNSEGTAGGSLPLGEALVRSVNGVFARLALDLGGGQIATQAGLMGVQTDLPAVPSLALGAAEVSVLDMATAYATLANHGTAIEPTTIARVELADGAVLEPRQRVLPHAVAPGNAYLLTRVMQQVIERGTGRAADIGRPAAGKTGTTNDYADAWFVGFTPDLVAAVWVGYPQGRIPMTNVHGIRVSGGTFPARIWQRFMVSAHAGLPVRDFRVPRSEYVRVEIDPITGLLAAPWCPGVERRMLRQLAPTTYCPPPPVETPEPAPQPSPSASGSAGKNKDDDLGDDRDDEQSDGSGKKKSGGDKPSPSPATEPTPTPSGRGG